MQAPDRRRLSHEELVRLRQAVAAQDDAVTRRALKRPSAHAAVFLAICVALWHGGPSGALSSVQRQAVVAGRFVSQPDVTAQSEQTSMKRMAILAAAAAIAANSAALAQSRGFARFGAASDTIRIQGNTVFGQGDYTYEARIRVLPGSGLGHLVSEQRNSLEDKSIRLAADGSYIASGCSGGATGDFRGTISGFAADEWLHLAYVHRGSTVSFYINGLLKETRVPVGCYGDRADSWMSIGMFRYGAPSAAQPASPSFLGDLDWIRISAGARYTKNFTPPYECEVLPDADTQLLLKFNEPAGTTTLIDESPNQFVCDVGVPVAPGVTATAPTLGNTEGGFPACQPCIGDITRNGTVDGVDLALILATWGTSGEQGSVQCDLDGDGVVGGSDLALVLSDWGACP